MLITIRGLKLLIMLKWIRRYI